VWCVLYQAFITTLVSHLPALFVFALTWAAGASTDDSGRPLFDAFLRGLMADKGHAFPFPATGTVYDFQFDRKEASARVHAVDAVRGGGGCCGYFD
jgi:hypothetical protein